MPRTTVTPTSISGGSSVGVGFVEFTWTAADASNGNQFVSTGKEFLIARNVNADSPLLDRIVTVLKTNGQIEYTLSGGEYLVAGQIPTSGYRQADNYIYLDGSHADIEFAVLVLP
jgi:hypothetical protein